MAETPKDFDEPLLLAAVDMIGRTGAKNLEIGFDDDNEDLWYAQATYGKSKVIVEGFDNPVKATEALVRKLMHGGRCTHCGKMVTLEDGMHSKRYCYYALVDINGGKKWMRKCS